MDAETRQEGSVSLGVFDAEASWRSSSLARLPAVFSSNTSLAELALDELLFPWQEGCGNLLTLLSIDTHHLQYLNTLRKGVYHSSVFDSVEAWRLSGSPENLFSVLSDSCCFPSQWDRLQLSPYAVTREFDHFASMQTGQGTWPPIDSVVTANSKVFSSECSSAFEPAIRSAVVRKLDAIRQFQTENSLETILLKDPFGVSGRGQYLIRDEASLERIEHYLGQQLRDGLEIELVVEAFTPFVKEFSSYFYLAADGSEKCRGIRQTLTRGPRYMGSVVPEISLLELLDRTEYYSVIGKYLGKIHELGYHGPICFDSAILESGEVRSVIEINARKSLGSIALDLALYLQSLGTDGDFHSTDLTVMKAVSMPDLLKRLEEAALLWSPDRSAGIIPLTSGSICFNGKNAAPRRSRLYYGVVGPNPAARDEVQVSFMAWCAAYQSFRITQ